jgi:hypothetical protein
MRILRPVYVVCLLAFTIVVVLMRVPSLGSFGAALVLKNLSPTKMIFVAEPMLCEQLKSQMEFAAHEEQEKIYQELLPLLKLDHLEFNARVSRESTLRNILDLINVDGPSGSGDGSARRCLLETLLMKKTETAKTLEELLHNRSLLEPSEPLFQSLLVDFIQKDCKGIPACSEALNAEIVKTKDRTKKFIFIDWLVKTGDPGTLKLFELFDGIDAKELAAQNAEGVALAAKLIEQIKFQKNSAPKTEELVLNEIQKRNSEVDYSALKKEMLEKIKKGDSLPKSVSAPDQPRPSGSPSPPPPPPFAEFLLEGQTLAKLYESQVPESNKEFKAWSAKAHSYAGTLTEPERKQLANVVSALLQATLDHLGPAAKFNKEILEMAVAAKINHILPILPSLLKNPGTALLGLQILSTETPFSEISQQRFLEVFPGVPVKDRIEVVIKMTVRSKELPISFLVRFAEILDDEEFYSGFAQRVPVDLPDFPAAFGKAEASVPPEKRNLQNLDWKLFLISKENVYEKRLLERWMKAGLCTEKDLFQIAKYYGQDKNVKGGFDLVKKVIACYSQVKLRRSISKVLEMFVLADAGRKAELLKFIKVSPDLSKADKSNLTGKVERLFVFR